MADENMELDERKVKILDAVIRNYLATGEPVGSRTISKYTDLNLSSATIRNEMADLEELGYIVQPHTSAGRIPSDKGYRFYVDHLMQEKDREVKEMKDFVIEKTQKMDEVLKKVAKMLANNTNYATIVSAPTYSGNKVKFMQLSNVDEKHILAVIVMNSNMVKNQMIDVEEPLDNETLLKLNILLNTALNGLSLQEINLGTISKLKEQAGVHSEIVSHVLDALGQTLSENEDLQIYTSGATNILKYPELADKSNAAQILSAFEEKKDLNQWIEQDPVSQNDDNHAIQVYIGGETQVESMKDCSLVTATYRIDDGVYGKVGIVGPKRMDYDKVVATLQSMMEQLDDIFKDNK